MLKSALTTHRSIYSLFVFVFLFLLVSQATVLGQPVPVLTLDAGGGVRAEISDYSVVGYRFTGTEYVGTFCFTITNTTQRPPEYYLPVRINAVIPGTQFSGQMNSVGFIEVRDFNEALVFNVDMALWVYLPILIEGVGIYPNQSGSFCFNVSRPNPFSVDDLISGVGATFSDGLGDVISGHNNNFPQDSGVQNSAVVRSTELTTNRYCFSVENGGPARIKGIGFDFPEERGPFHLISADFSQRENFLNIPRRTPAGIFSTNQKRLRLPGDIDFEPTPRLDIFDELDFAILAPGPIRNGRPAFRSSEFSACIGGDFSDLSPLVEVFSLIRWEDSWGTADIVVGGGIKGTVATNPR